MGAASLETLGILLFYLDILSFSRHFGFILFTLSYLHYCWHFIVLPSFFVFINVSVLFTRLYYAIILDMLSFFSTFRHFFLKCTMTKKKSSSAHTIFLMFGPNRLPQSIHIE